MSDAEIVTRLERLERDNRRLERAGVALLVMLAAMTTIYATRPVPDTIKAHHFDVVDSNGIVQASMGLSIKGEPTIGLMNWQAKGVGGLQMSVSSEGAPSIVLTDAQGFMMDLGSTGTLIGEAAHTRHASAASIVMCGKDKEHHVIWKAP